MVGMEEGGGVRTLLLWTNWTSFRDSLPKTWRRGGGVEEGGGGDNTLFQRMGFLLLNCTLDEIFQRTYA